MSTATRYSPEVMALYRKIDLRILPFLLVCYLFACLDRVNVSFAKLHMQSDLGLSDAAYGLGAGIFFIGYALFETPSNLLMIRIGARKTLSRVMILWGITSSCMFLVNSETSFYALRFLLGVFEAGFAPGMIYYLTLWYGRDRLGRVMAFTMLAGPISGIIGAPLSTWIMSEFADVGGLRGWQWMFLIEGIPAVMLGLLALKLLSDTPAKAIWLSAKEKAAHARLVNRDAGGHHALGAALRDPRIYLMALGYFCLICGIYAMNFWLPTIIRDNGVDNLMTIGVLTAIPYAVAILFMLALGRSADRLNERRWHTAVPAVLAAVCLGAATLFKGSLGASLTCLALGTALLWAAYTVFWSIPPQYLKGTAAAGGIAVINTIGLLGGFVSPTLIGLLKSHTGQAESGILAMVAIIAVGALLLAANKPKAQSGFESSVPTAIQK